MELPMNTLTRRLVAGLSAALLVSSIVAPAYADAPRPAAASLDDEKAQIELQTTIYEGWHFATTGRVLVDGVVARASDRVKNGSRIVVSDDSAARAEIEGLGRLSIASRSELMIDVVDDTVVAHLVRGNVRVELGPQFNSYVETPDSYVVSHKGTPVSFRVTASPLGSSLERTLGAVEMEDSDKGDGWDIDPYDMDDDMRVKARKKETLKIKLKNDSGRVANQAVNFTITSALDGASGSLNDAGQRVTVMTDSDGVAEVEFYAGAAEGSVYVEAAIPGTEARETLHLTVDAPEKTFWNKYTTGLYIALGAGAVAGAVIAIENAGGSDNDPRITPGPPVVTTR